MKAGAPPPQSRLVRLSELVDDDLALNEGGGAAPAIAECTRGDYRQIAAAQ